MRGFPAILIIHIVFFYFFYSFMKMKAYTVCARAQASFFYGPLAIQSKKKHRQIVEEV